MRPLQPFVAASLCAALLAAFTARAALSPEVYAAMKEGAPEVVELEVVEVSTGICVPFVCWSRSITVSARVRTVERSASGLVPGQLIELSYQHNLPSETRVVETSIPILEKRRTYRAWLRQNARGGYEPAAIGASFEVLVGASAFERGAVYARRMAMRAVSRFTVADSS